jgi:hypothetical protein
MVAHVYNHWPQAHFEIITPMIWQLEKSPTLGMILKLSRALKTSGSTLVAAVENQV